MLSMTKAELRERAGRFVKTLGATGALVVELIEGVSAVGGGASPDFQPETVLIALSHSRSSAEKLEYTLRHSDPPAISRIVDDKVVLDLRTVSESEEGELIRILGRL